MNEIAINKAHYPVTTLGHGTRIGIWLQGCSIRCKGCVSRDTWEYDPGKRMPIYIIVQWCQDVSAQGLDGITISGGEPFEQPHSLAELLASLRQWTANLAQPVDFLCYSGIPFRSLREQHGDILGQLDAVIPEPYVHNRPGAALRGSDNQLVIPLSGLGAERYSDPGSIKDGKQIQVAVDEGGVWFIGIPKRGDMQRLEERCRRRGLTLGPSSWRA